MKIYISISCVNTALLQCLKLREPPLRVAQQETHPSASHPTLITAKSTFTPNGKLI